MLDCLERPVKTISEIIKNAASKKKNGIDPPILCT
jgi:hypothetical protein